MRRIDRLLKDTPVRQRTAYQMREALTRHYLGCGSKGECLQAMNGCSESSYYRVRNNHPELAEAIEDSARLEALMRVSDETIAFQARQKRRSHTIQGWAIDALGREDIQDAIVRLALGGVHDVVVDGEVKHIVPYPRDQIRAFRLLVKLARGGTLPEAKKDPLEFLDRIPEYDEGEHDHGGLTLDEFVLATGIPTQFTRITATKADGQEIKSTVAWQGDEDPHHN